MSYYAPSRMIKIDGLTMSADLTDRVTSVTYDSSVASADMFRIALDNSDLSLTDSPLLTVGKDVEVHMGYERKLEPMMLGELTAIEPTFPSGGAPSISLVGYDKSHRLRHNSPGRFTWKKTNESAIAAQIAAENLLIPVVDPAPSFRSSVQQTGSDWALLKEMAERNFFDVYVRWDKLYFRLPRPQTKQVVLEWGKNLTSFSPRLSTAGQMGIEVLRGYDHELAQAITMVLPAISVGDDLDAMVERLGDEVLQQLVKLGRHVVRGERVSNFVDATVVAKSLLMQVLQGLYEGSATCVGIPELRAGDTVEIRGVGKRFSGIYKMSKVSHTMDGSGYTSRLELSQKWGDSMLKGLRKTISAKPSPDKQESASNIMIGIVESNKDPKGLGRVQVSLPTLNSQNLSEWAPIASQTAAKDSGFQFTPDAGDVVLVAFVDGDINKPFVLGGFWDQMKMPPFPNWDGQNATKTIKLKSGMMIRFDETTGAEKLELVDVKGSKIVLDSSTGDIVIEAKNNVVIKSGQTGRIDLNPT